jgi:hypothetical protein
LYIGPRVVDQYLEDSVVAFHAEYLDEVIAAEQGDLTEGEGPPGSAAQGATPRSQRSRVSAYKEERQIVKKAIAIKLLKSKSARRVAIKALQNKKVRGIVVNLAKRRVLGR